MSFAVDPGVLTTAYVAEKLGLPSCGSYQSVKILQNKALFRKFLANNDFNVPKAFGTTTYDEAIRNLKSLKMPVIVKPVDAAGSKGVMKVQNISELKDAFEFAKSFSITKEVIIEEFIEKNGFSSDSDGFTVDGKLLSVSFNRQYFDDEASNPYTPSAYSWPSSFTQEQEIYLKNELQRLITLLNLKTSVYNIEVRVDKEQKPYIMELSPRGGGNRLSEMIRFGTGVDFISNAVRAAVGMHTENINSLVFDGYWAEIILHSNVAGNFSSIGIDEKYRNNIIEEDVWVKKGNPIKTFQGANDAIGTLVLRFDNQEEMEFALNKRDEWVKISVE